jgi:hypothetical protein
LSRIFTLDEAQMVLPVLEALLLKARDAALLANTLEEQMQELSQRIFLSGGMHVDVPAAARRRAEREKAMQEARSSLEEIQEIGVQVSDLGEGTLEFPAQLEGRDVLLCWRIGDARIDHWRETSDAADVRRDIDLRFGRGDRPN